MNCVTCAHFMDDPARIEAMIPGMTTLGSAHASVRSDDGICLVHDLIVSPRDGCEKFKADRDRP